MLQSWAPDARPLRLVERARPSGEPKALACYGLLVRAADAPEEVWLRFVDGRPVSGVTTSVLAWCAARLAARGKRALLLSWDQAAWHLSREVRAWLRAHNRQVKVTGQGVRIVMCPLPKKSPWLNPMEPKWVHGKRRVVEPAATLPPEVLEARVYAAFNCPPAPHLAMPQQVA